MKSLPDDSQQWTEEPESLLLQVSRDCLRRELKHNSTINLFQHQNGQTLGLSSQLAQRNVLGSISFKTLKNFTLNESDAETIFMILNILELSVLYVKPFLPCIGNDLLAVQKQIFRKTCFFFYHIKRAQKTKMKCLSD